MWTTLICSDGGVVGDVVHIQQKNTDPQRLSFCGIKVWGTYVGTDPELLEAELVYQVQETKDELKKTISDLTDKDQKLELVNNQQKTLIDS